jgi:YegS/Rv2252/BmrU family lipid kinase
MLLIFNPSSGQQLFRDALFPVVDNFTKNGFLVTIYPTQKSKDAYEIILRHGAEYDYLVCSGGDGTLGEAIDALMLMERRPTFGFIPSGTTNDFSTSIGIPKDILLAAEVVTSGVARPFDIGKFGEEYFSYVAAFGLFTDVSYDTPQERKNSLGHMAYLMEGVKRLGSIQSHACSIQLPDELIEGEFILGMISNSLSIGGFRVSRQDGEIRMDDGLFEVILLRKPKNFIDLQNVIASILNQDLYTDSLILRRTASLTIHTDEPLAWSLDGEFGGALTDVTITNCHNAIEIMLPE